MSLISLCTALNSLPVFTTNEFGISVLCLIFLWFALSYQFHQHSGGEGRDQFDEQRHQTPEAPPRAELGAQEAQGEECEDLTNMQCWQSVLIPISRQVTFPSAGSVWGRGS